MLTHSLMAGSSALLLAQSIMPVTVEWFAFIKMLLTGSILFNLVLMFLELTVTHPTQDARMVVSMIVSGRYKRMFWIGAISLGNLAPLLAFLADTYPLQLAPLFALAGIFFTEKIWVEAPQRIPQT
jgi:hypothetical protein